MKMREKIFKYVKDQYKTEPDYPFSTFPDYPVLRHGDNGKWFALIMNVPREKLGLKGEERVDIVNVKLGDPVLVNMLVQRPGYFTGIISVAATGFLFCWMARFLLMRYASGSMKVMR